jgi:hypothetical protein
MYPAPRADETALDALEATSFLPVLLPTIAFRLRSGYVLWRVAGEPVSRRYAEASR